MSKDIMPLPSVEGLGAGVTSRVPTLTRLMGTKDLKPSPLTVTVEPGPPLVVGQGDDPFRYLVGYRGYHGDAVNVIRRTPLMELLDGIAAVVGMRSWLSKRPLASGSAETVVVLPLLASYTIWTLKLDPSSFLLGKPLPRTTAMVPTRPESGVTVTSRLGMSTITTPVRPRESETRIARSPSAVVASAKGRSTEADQLPPLSTRTGSPSLIRLWIGRPPMLTQALQRPG